MINNIQTMLNGILSPLKKQGANILTLVIMFITVLVLFKILGVNFNPDVNKRITKVVTVDS